jgi:hypothetical protein
MFKTDILELTQTHADPDGPYAPHHAGLDRTSRWILRWARRPERFAPAVARALEDRAPFARRGTDVSSGPPSPGWGPVLCNRSAL